MANWNQLAKTVGKSFSGSAAVTVKAPSGMQFFDRSIMKRKWKRMNASPLKRAGLMVRKFAVQSIRKRVKPSGKSKRKPKPSPIGTAPRSRAAGHPMRKIFTVSDMLATRETVGALGFGEQNPVPGLHEHGGFARRRVWVKSHQHRTKKGRFGKNRMKPVVKMVRYGKRPFMMPALEKARGKFPQLWRGSLTKAA